MDTVPNDIVKYSLTFNHLDILKWIYEECSYNSINIDWLYNSLENEAHDITKWLLENGCPTDENILTSNDWITYNNWLLSN